METFNICWLTILKEAKKDGASFVKKSAKELGSCSNFDLPLSRLEYLYKHGVLIINLVAQGILKSSQQNPQILDLFNKVISKQNCEIFSLSNGPGVEVVGFAYGFNKLVNNAFKNVSVSVATTCVKWKAASETLITGTLQSSLMPMVGDMTFCTPSNFKFLPYEMTALSPEVRQNIQHCDMLLMYKSYEFAPDVNLFKAILTEIFSLMKNDALLFLFDGKSRMKLFSSLAGCGKILFGPQRIKVKDIPCNTSIIKAVGMKPRQEGNVRFALWKKTAPSEKIEATHKAITPNINIQKQSLDTLVNNNIEKCSPHMSSFFNNTIGITNELPQNSNSCKDVFSEHISQNKLTAKTIKEINLQNFISNEESVSDKSRTMSEISISSNYSTNQKFLKTDSANPIMLGRVNKEDSDYNESPITSKLACIKDLNYREERTNKSKIDVMIERCEQMVSDLEKRIEKLTTKAPSSENLHENCCNQNRKVPHNFYCPSQLHMPCSILQCCNHSRHHFTCRNEPAKFNCVQRTAISSGNNAPYLLIPLGNQALFTDTVTKLLNKS